MKKITTTLAVEVKENESDEFFETLACFIEWLTDTRFSPEIKKVEVNVREENLTF